MNRSLAPAQLIDGVPGIASDFLNLLDEPRELIADATAWPSASKLKLLRFAAALWPTPSRKRDGGPPGGCKRPARRSTATALARQTIKEVSIMKIQCHPKTRS